MEEKEDVVKFINLSEEVNILLVKLYEIAKNECMWSYSWFLQKLHNYIGDLEPLTFIYDRVFVSCPLQIYS